RYFFFHADDGIRDATVTGVQTCALPILKSQMCFSNCNGLLSLQSYPQFSRHLLALSAANEDSVRGYNVGSEDPCRNRAGNSWLRSEERRVGKECRDGLAEALWTEKGCVS